MKPGLYTEAQLSMDDYHAARDVVGRSALKLMDEGVPADTRRYLDEPDDSCTAAMAFGTAVQACLRSRADFAERYTRTPIFAGPNAAPEFKGTGARDRIKAWREANAGKIQLPASDYDLALDAAREVKETRSAARILEHPEIQHESSLVWEEPKHGGRLVKARPDFLIPGISADLKVDGRGDLSDRKLAEYVAHFYAHLQGAMCMRGMIANGLPFKAHVLIVVRRKHPVKCRTVVMTLEESTQGPSWLECGEAQFDALLAEFVQCERANSWPDYGDQGTTLPVPAYVASKIGTYHERLETATAKEPTL